MQTFLKVLDPEDSSTGGGSASALAGAMAGGLLAMAARLSESYLEGVGKNLHTQMFTQASQLSMQLLEGSKEDSQAFQSVRSAYQFPRQTDEQKNLRQQAIQSAWLVAAHVPLQNAGHCLSLLELGAELAEHVNPKVRSDLRCALLLARAGLLGCLENVQINLPEIKNVASAAQLAGKASDLRRRFTNLELSAAFDSPEI